MGVFFQRQSEMAQTARIIFCLLHASQHHRRDDRIGRIVFERIQKLLQLQRTDLFNAAFKALAHQQDNLRKIPQLLRLRRFMHPVQGRNLKPFHVPGHAFVSRDHEILNDHFRFLALAHLNFLNFILFV